MDQVNGGSDGVIVSSPLRFKAGRYLHTREAGLCNTGDSSVARGRGERRNARDTTSLYRQNVVGNTIQSGALRLVSLTRRRLGCWSASAPHAQHIAGLAVRGDFGGLGEDAETQGIHVARLAVGHAA
jgi:hypothetical protein